ncbi:MAG: co-chaperone GroES family protein [Candidatus Sabulitectum sp.]|nr:co-chaperone GroES family protein [Candidatus Sabulitectum sp.]
MADSIFIGAKQLIVTGDRILVSPPVAGERTDSGLFVPDSAVDKRKVMSGWVEAVGPGYPIPDAGNSSEEPWKSSETPAIKHYPLQVEKGDYVLYVKNAAWEIRLETGKFFVVPYSSVLVILRAPLDVQPENN